MSPGLPDEPPAEGLIEGFLQRGEQSAAPDSEAAAELLTFFFADIRGYTKFTQQRGDMAASLLTAKFARIVRELVAQFGGTVVELRGDEAMCVFSSPRQSLKLAVTLQQRFVEETVADPSLPMAVGIGIDVGEAEHGADGYRGGALNLAARLCAQAKAGEVLASSEVVHLARTIDGIRYIVHGRVALKGFEDRVRPVRVMPEGNDPAREIEAVLSAATVPTPVRWLPRPLARRPRATLIGAVVVAAALVVGLMVALVRDPGGSGLTALSENSLGLVDPRTGHLDGEVGVGAGPMAVVAGFGSVWTANSDDGTVSRVETTPLRVSHTIDVGLAPAAIAVGMHSVWVVNSGSGTVSRIDPSTNVPTSITVGTAPRGIVAALGSVWVTNSLGGTVSRIDPNRNATVETITVGDGPTGISAGRDLWVVDSLANTVTVLDGVTHAITKTIPVGTNPQGISVVGNNVWVTNSVDGTVARIAITGTSVAETVPVAAGSEVGPLAAGNTDLWVALQTSGAIADIDPAAPHAIRRVVIGPNPGAITAGANRLWVTATTDPTRHRGGVLRIQGDDIGSIDPQYFLSLGAVWLLLDNAYDGLFAFQHTTGADAAVVVPDLATGKPAPTNGGRTYTFHVRSGVRWSTGAQLTVGDVRRGIERAIAYGLTALGHQIRGSGGCRPSACTISGIAVDSRDRTVTITLVRPNANFIDDLAVSTIAVPESTPLAEDRIHPVPTTGPYQVARYEPGKLVVLTRNKYFHEWSAAAQPGGFPDRIEWQIDPKDDKGVPAVNSVAAGRTDWADARFAAPLGVLQARFAGRVHTTLTQTIHALSLNTRIPPFNDVRVRRALAFALDRGAISRSWPTPALVTCQVLPPNYSGYRPYCPYTLNRDDSTGKWSGPDLATAFRLVRQSHTQGMSVTVYDSKGSTAAFRYVIKALRELGYHARLVILDKDYFEFVTDSRNKVQAGFYGWVTSDGTAAELLDLYRCSTYIAASRNNQSPSGFCDPSIDRLIDRARVKEASSLAAASTLWAEADRRIVDEAPWIPLVTPSWVDVVSTRVHNYKRSPVLGVLLDQMWVH